MRILLIADPHIPVPPRHYGGAERIVHLYGQEFSRLGHQVVLLAGPGSRGYGHGLHIHRPPSLRYPSRARRKLQFQLQSLWAARGCDVVFNHGRFDYLEALLASRRPLLHRFANPIDQQQIDFAERRVRGPFSFHCISADQRHHARISQPCQVIPNPIRTADYRQGSGSGGYLAFLGRLTRAKGIDTAIAVARRSGLPLRIAGNLPDEPGAREFFEREVAPHLDGERIRWIGPVDDRGKQELLGEALALLFPIRWDEPFGIVMLEALACGTPVIATRRASTPEVIEHGRTGWLCDPAEAAAEPRLDAFLEGVAQAGRLDRRACREAAESRFDVQPIAERVLTVLRELADQGKA